MCHVKVFFILCTKQSCPGFFSLVTHLALHFSSPPSFFPSLIHTWQIATSTGIWLLASFDCKWRWNFCWSTWTHVFLQFQMVRIWLDHAGGVQETGRGFHLQKLKRPIGRGFTDVYLRYRMYSYQLALLSPSYTHTHIQGNWLHSAFNWSFRRDAQQPGTEMRFHCLKYL